MTYCVLFPLVESAPELVKFAVSLERKESFVLSVLSALTVAGIGAFFLLFFSLVVAAVTVFGAFVVADVAGGLKEDLNGFVRLTFTLWKTLTVSVAVCGFVEAIAQCIQHSSKGKETPRLVGWYLNQNYKLRLFLSTVVGSLMISLIVMGDLAFKTVA